MQARAVARVALLQVLRLWPSGLMQVRPQTI